MAMPPTQQNDQPLQIFSKGIKTAFDIIQKICKPKPIWIGPWDPEQSSNFPPWKSKEDIPSGKTLTHREIFSAYFGGYIDPNPKGETMYSKLRFITPADSNLDLTKLGSFLRGAF